VVSFTTSPPNAGNIKFVYVAGFVKIVAAASVPQPSAGIDTILVIVLPKL
jgi:hypothetical protein